MDLAMAAVFVWLYDRVYAVYGGSLQKGMMWGLYVGIFANFPAQIGWHMIIKDFPYALGWWWCIIGIVYAMIAGIISGALYKKGAKTA
jgi:hypothetical protein